MKSCLCACALALLIAIPALAQSETETGQANPPQPGGISGATIPVIRTPTPNTGTDAVGGTTPAAGGAQAQPGLVVTRPVPESTIQPNYIQHAPTPAEVAADQAIRKQADESVSSYAERVSDTCDADFKARIDWTTVSPLETHRYSPADACGAALQAIEEICANPAAKARVASEVKSVICTTGPQPAIEMHAGTLVYVIDWQSENPGARVYSWLATHL